VTTVIVVLSVVVAVQFVVISLILRSTMANVRSLQAAALASTNPQAAFAYMQQEAGDERSPDMMLDDSVQSDYDAAHTLVGLA